MKNRPHINVNRRIAKKLNIDHYYTGKACANGHFALRKTNHGVCVKCAILYNERRRERYANEPIYRDHIQLTASELRKAHPERYRKYDQDSYNKRRTQIKEYYQNNKEQIRAKAKAWKKANPEKVKKQKQRYRQRKLAKQQAVSSV